MVHETICPVREVTGASREFLQSFGLLIHGFSIPHVLDSVSAWSCHLLGSLMMRMRLVLRRKSLLLLSTLPWRCGLSRLAVPSRRHGGRHSWWTCWASPWRRRIIGIVTPSSLHIRRVVWSILEASSMIDYSITEYRRKCCRFWLRGSNIWLVLIPER